jgi:hypothetical protein
MPERYAAVRNKFVVPAEAGVQCLSLSPPSNLVPGTCVFSSHSSLDTILNTVLPPHLIYNTAI